MLLTGLTIFKNKSNGTIKNDAMNFKTITPNFYQYFFDPSFLVKDSFKTRLISKEFALGHTNIYDTALTVLAEQYDLLEDYHAYLKVAIKDDLGLLQNDTWGNLFQSFQLSKIEILKKIFEICPEGFNTESLSKNQLGQLHALLMSYAAKGDFVSVYHLLKAKAPILLFDHSDIKFPVMAWGNLLINGEGAGSAIHAACYAGSLGCMKIIFQSLNDRGIVLNFNNMADKYLYYHHNYHITNGYRITPLHYLVIPMKRNHYLNPDLVTFFIEKGMKIDEELKTGTALHHAVREFPLTMLRLKATFNDQPASLEFLADQKQNRFELLRSAVFDTNDWKCDPSWKRSAFQTLNTLLSLGADINKKNTLNKSVLEIAKIATDMPRHFTVSECKRRGYNKIALEKFMQQCYQELVSYLNNEIKKSHDHQQPKAIHQSVRLRLSRA